MPNDFASGQRRNNVSPESVALFLIRDASEDSQHQMPGLENKIGIRSIPETEVRFGRDLTKIVAATADFQTILHFGE